MKRKTTFCPRRITLGAMIAALYVVFTALSSLFGLASGPIQLRLSEMLSIFPIFFVEAVPGLFVGCLLSNMLTGCAPWDVVFGSLATLIGALGAYFLKFLPKRLRWIATLPTVLANAFIVPLVLIFVYGIEDSFLFLLLTVGLGELISAGVLGSILYYLLLKSGFERLIIKT